MNSITVIRIVAGVLFFIGLYILIRRRKARLEGQKKI